MNRPEPAEQRGRVVVGVDGSPSSLHALEWAVQRATLTRAVVEAVTAWHYPAAVAGYHVKDRIDWKANAQAVQDTAVKEALGDEATSLVRRVVQGHPVRVLLDAAEGADLLVVGSRGYGGFTALLLGSVSGQAVAHAPCTVVVVRPPLTASTLPSIAL